MKYDYLKRLIQKNHPKKNPNRAPFHQYPPHQNTPEKQPKYTGFRKNRPRIPSKYRHVRTPFFMTMITSKREEIVEYRQSVKAGKIRFL